MKYSFFLFIKLYDVFIGVDYNYQALYNDLTDLFKDFELYSVNSNLNQYDCMVQFFQDNRSQIFSDFLKNKN